MDRIKQGSNRTEELNQRISTRNIPSNNLQMSFGIRPVSTKYATMPLVDQRVTPTVPIEMRDPYNVEDTFNPGNSYGPWSGFSNNINNESKLRNQFFALQRGAGQGVYIPSKNSDMYESMIPQTNNSTATESFPYLFERQTFEAFNPMPDNIGNNFFSNFTRQQIKEIK